MLDAALDLIARKIPVFPIWGVSEGRCHCGNRACDRTAKHPIGKLVPKGFLNATTDEETVRGWWKKYPTANIGVPTGRASGIDVLDMDVKENKDGFASLKKLRVDLGLPADCLSDDFKTPIAKSGGGGRHFCLIATGTMKTDSDTFGEDYPGIDTKGEGGYIVAAPSSHKSGNRYQWIRDLETPLAPWPAEILARLNAQKTRERGERDPEDDGLTGVEDGKGRTKTMVEWVGRWISKGLTQSTVETLAAVRNRTNDPPLEDDKVTKIIESIWKAEQAKTTTATIVTPLDLVRASEITIRNVPWTWFGYFPRGAMALIVGDPEVNKTTVCLDYAARVTTGRPFANGAPGSGTPEPVIFLSAEDSPSYTIIPRFLAAGGNPKLLFVIKLTIGAPMFSLEKDIAQLEASVRETRARHIIIDPLNAYLPTVDSWKDSAIRSALSPLAALAEQRDLDVHGVMHLNKKTDYTALHRVMGSVAYTAMARAVYLVAKDPDNSDRRLFLCSKMSVAVKPPGLAFVLRPAILRTAGESEDIRTLMIAWDTSQPVTATADSVLQRSARVGPGEQATQLITELLNSGPVPAAEMERELEAAGLTDKTIERAKGKAGVMSIKEPRPDGVWYWTPPGFTVAQRLAWREGKRAAPSDEGEERQ
jgi:hypothetical protein